jgi:RND family efflux transporter MFP subunit
LNATEKIRKPLLDTLRFGMLTLLACQTAWMVGCKPAENAKGAEKAKSENAVTVRGSTITVAEVTWPKEVRCQGSLVADEVSIVGAKVAGRIVRVPVDLGDAVCKDAVLVELDPKDYQLQAEQADAQLLQARSAIGLKPGDAIENLNPDNSPPVREARAVWDETKQAVARIRQLSDRDAVSETDLEVAESAERVASARYTSAQNGVREKMALVAVQTALRELAHQRLAETKVLSPFTGLAETRSAAIGTYVQPGQSLMSIAKVDRLRFRGSVPERFAQQLKIGQPVELSFDLSDQKRTVAITRISPSLDPLNRSLVFEANVENADGLLRSGLFAEGVIVLDPESQGIAIPMTALVRFAGVDKVWKVVDNQLKEQSVVLGRQRDDRIEILSGVSVGDVLLLNAKDGKQGKFEQE